MVDDLKGRKKKEKWSQESKDWWRRRDLAGLCPWKGVQYKRRFLSGSSTKSFTPDTADMSLNPENRQDGNNNKEFPF